LLQLAVAANHVHPELPPAPSAAMLDQIRSSDRERSTHKPPAEHGPSSSKKKANERQIEGVQAVSTAELSMAWKNLDEDGSEVVLQARRTIHAAHARRSHLYEDPSDKVSTPGPSPLTNENARQVKQRTVSFDDDEEGADGGNSAARSTDEPRTDSRFSSRSHSGSKGAVLAQRFANRSRSGEKSAPATSRRPTKNSCVLASCMPTPSELPAPSSSPINSRAAAAALEEEKEAPDGGAAECTSRPSENGERLVFLPLSA
jgi:hypothetical protein